MAQVTEADLRNAPAIYNSSRRVGEVLIGEDDAGMVIKACSSGDNATLQKLLSEPKCNEIMLQKTHSIYSENRPSRGPDDVRGVSARPMSHLERALETAAESGHAPCVSTLLSFAEKQGIGASKLVHRLLLGHVIYRGHAAVVRELVSAYPDIISTQINHGAMPLYEAVRTRKTDVAAVLLEMGADPLKLWDDPPNQRLTSYPSSLMSMAAMARGPRMTEMLLQRNLPIAGTGALHAAAACESVDTMRVLCDHGADVNEVLTDWKQWAPMHFAASRGKTEAIKWLEEKGGRLDMKDEDGKTPKQLLEEHNIEK